MRRWVKSVLGGAACVFFVAAGADGWHDHRDHLQVAEAEHADQEQLERLRAEFPPGSTLSRVHAGLQADDLDVPDYNGEWFLPQGQQPSLRWYCGPYSRYIVFSFDPEAMDSRAFGASTVLFEGELSLMTTQP